MNIWSALKRVSIIFKPMQQGSKWDKFAVWDGLIVWVWFELGKVKFKMYAKWVGGGSIANILSTYVNAPIWITAFKFVFKVKFKYEYSHQ